MPHILAIDDDPDLCALLQTALQRDGHTVQTCQSGAAVTETLCRWADCILLDVMMPGEDGFAICRRIRALTACWSPPGPSNSSGWIPWCLTGPKSRSLTPCWPPCKPWAKACKPA